MSKNPRDKKHSQLPPSEISRVDLGDDLVIKTKTLARDPRVTAQPAVKIEPGFDIEDQLHSAQILLGEGLGEEAKKILRRILVLDPRHLVARKTLEEIQDQEIREIFNDSPRRRRPTRTDLVDAPDASLTEVEAEKIMRALDRDLKLGIYGDAARVSRLESPALGLFSSEQDIEKYAESLEKDLRGCSGQDRIDLGIAFLEMGLHELSLRQFRAASHLFLQSQSQSAMPEQWSSSVLSTSALIAYTLILVGRAYEATMLIQGILRDQEIKHENKLEFFYLMGRAYETMRKDELARGWFHQVMQIDPKYRDAEARARGKR